MYVRSIFRREDTIDRQRRRLRELSPLQPSMRALDVRTNDSAANYTAQQRLLCGHGTGMCRQIRASEFGTCNFSDAAPGDCAQSSA